MAMLPSGFIVFGILHLIGLSIILAPFFFRFKEKNMAIGLIIISIGLAFSFLNGPYFLLPLGIHPADFFSYDYEPLFPWFGIVIIGIYFGSLIYPNGKPILVLPEKSGIIQEFFCLLGRNSLLIYMSHQPIILGIIYFVVH
jgi:uncharacterized membrane protein